jgi:hypothetical protein
MLKLQKRAARFITSSGLEERPSKIFQMLKWTKIQSILKKREWTIPQLTKILISTSLDKIPS